MKTLTYVVFTKRGVSRATRKAPRLSGGEFAVKLSLEIPDRFFAAEHPEVALTLAERDIIAPVVAVVDPNPPSE